MLLGGSPLRLFRISERARQLVERWGHGAESGRAGRRSCLARRLVSARRLQPAADLEHPRAGRRHGRRAGARPARATRPTARALWRQGLACIVVDDASADAGATKEIAERHGAAFVGLADQRRPGRARATPGWPRCTARSSRSSTPTACPPTGGSSRCWATSTTRWWRPWRRVSCRRRLATRGRYEAVAVVARPGRRCKARCGREPHPLRARARPSWSAPTWRRAPTSSTLRCAAARTSTWSGVWARPAGTCATSRRARSPTKARPRWRTSWSAAPSTGRRPAPLTRRHGEAVAPAASLRLVAGRLGPAAGAAGPCSRWPRCRRPSSILARRLRGLVRDPVGVAAQIAGGGTTALGPAGARLVDAGLVARSSCSGWPSAGPAPSSALALVVPALHEWAADRQELRPGARRGRPRGRRRRLRHRGLGRLRAGADARAAHPAGRLAGPRLVAPALRERAPTTGPSRPTPASGAPTTATG